MMFWLLKNNENNWIDVGAIEKSCTRLNHLPIFF